MSWGSLGRPEGREPDSVEAAAEEGWEPEDEDELVETVIIESLLEVSEAEVDVLAVFEVSVAEMLSEVVASFDVAVAEEVLPAVAEVLSSVDEAAAVLSEVVN